MESDSRLVVRLTSMSFGSRRRIDAGGLVSMTKGRRERSGEVGAGEHERMMNDGAARILIVDDEPNVVATMQPVFTLEGYDVDVATSEYEARRAFGERPYDAVITDLRLVEGDGLALVAELQRERPGTPAIILTGFGSLESAIEAMHRGAYDYLLKPCSVDELKSTVRRAVSHGRLTRELHDRVAALGGMTTGTQPDVDELQRALERVQGLVAEVDGTKRELELALGRERATVARLRELDELKRQFISNVSHELRTPLTSIRGYASLLASRLSGAGSSVESPLGAITRAADQLHRLIEDLLDMAAIESGKLRVDVEPVDVREAVDAATVMVRPMAQRKRLRIATKIAQQLPRVRADPGRLGQVLNNLLTNAVKFTPEGGSISVEARLGVGLVHVLVNDTGIGIPPDEQQHLFSRFFRARAARDTEHRGMGLGLSISRAIIEAHSGLVWLESEAGRGTTVHFTLPVFDGADRSAALNGR